MEDLYNIALDCVDKHSQSLHNKHKVALIFVQGSPSPSATKTPADKQPSLRSESGGEGERFSPPSMGGDEGEGDRVVKLTFSNLEGLTNRFANVLLNLDHRPGERLLVRLPNGPEFPVTFLGAIKAGLIPIPTSPLNTWRELQLLLEDSESSVLVTAADLLPTELLDEKPLSLKNILLLSPQGKTLPSGTQRWEDLLKKASSTFQTEPTEARAPAFWLYTSGTEGRPKAVIHAHRSIRAHDSRAKLWQDLKANDVIFNTSALNWSYALTCGMLDVWRHGLPTLIHSGDLSPKRIVRLVEQFGVTTFMSVPGIYRKLVEHLSSPPLPDPLPPGERAKEGLPLSRRERVTVGDTFSKVRVCLSAGEKLSEEVEEKFRALTGLPIYEGLGMTEHSVYLIQPYGEPRVKGSCGKPVPDSRIAILRDDLSRAEAGETGILASHRSCPGLMLDYYYHKNPPNPPFSKGDHDEFPPLKKGQVEVQLRRAANTAEFAESDSMGGFCGDWFLSGDLAHLDAQGNFFFQGRRDDVITSGGYRISPLEVEGILNQCPIVLESAAVAMELPQGKTIVAAHVVLNPQTFPDEEAKSRIKLYAEKHLAKYKVPREIFFVKTLFKTQSGKIKRKELKKEGE